MEAHWQTASASGLSVFALRHQPVSPLISSCGARERGAGATRREASAGGFSVVWMARPAEAPTRFAGGAKRGAQRPAGGPPEASSDRPQLGWLPSRRQAPSGTVLNQLPFSERSDPRPPEASSDRPRLGSLPSRRQAPSSEAAAEASSERGATELALEHAWRMAAPTEQPFCRQQRRAHHDC